MGVSGFGTITSSSTNEEKQNHPWTSRIAIYCESTFFWFLECCYADEKWLKMDSLSLIAQFTIVTLQLCHFLYPIYETPTWDTSPLPQAFFVVTRFVSHFPGIASDIQCIVAVSVMMLMWVSMVLAGICYHRFGWVKPIPVAKYAMVWVPTALFIPITSPLVRFVFPCLSYTRDSYVVHPFHTTLSCWDDMHLGLSVLVLACLCAHVGLCYVCLLTFHNTTVPTGNQTAHHDTNAVADNTAAAATMLGSTLLLILAYTATTHLSRYFLAAAQLLLGGHLCIRLYTHLPHWHPLAEALAMAQASLCGWTGAVSLFLLAHDDTSSSAVLYFAGMPITAVAAVIAARHRYHAVLSLEEAQLTSAALVHLKARAVLRSYYARLRSHGDVYVEEDAHLFEHKTEVLRQVEAVLRLGVRRFSSSPRLRAFNALLYVHLFTNRVLAYTELRAAAAARPPLDVRVLLHLLQDVLREATSAEQSREVRDYLHFKARSSLAQATTRAALRVLIDFWTELLAPRLNAARLSSVATLARARLAAARDHYHTLLQLNPHSVPVLREAGLLHLELLGEVMAGAEMLNRADEVEASFARQMRAVDYNQFLNKQEYELDIFDEANGVVTLSVAPETIGIIDTVNRSFLRMFGFNGAADVIGKSVDCVVPPPLRRHHDDFIRRYVDNRESRTVNYVRLVLGINQMGFLLPLSLYVRWADEAAYRMIGVVQGIRQAGEVCAFFTSDDWDLYAATETLHTLLGYSKKAILARAISLRHIVPALRDADMDSDTADSVLAAMSEARGLTFATEHRVTGAKLRVRAHLRLVVMGDDRFYYAHFHVQHRKRHGRAADQGTGVVDNGDDGIDEIDDGQWSDSEADNGSGGDDGAGSSAGSDMNYTPIIRPASVSARSSSSSLARPSSIASSLSRPASSIRLSTLAAGGPRTGLSGLSLLCDGEAVQRASIRDYSHAARAGLAEMGVLPPSPMQCSPTLITTTPTDAHCSPSTSSSYAGSHASHRMSDTLRSSARSFSSAGVYTPMSPQVYTHSPTQVYARPTAETCRSLGLTPQSPHRASSFTSPMPFRAMRNTATTAPDGTFTSASAASVQLHTRPLSQQQHQQQQRSPVSLRSSPPLPIRALTTHVSFPSEVPPLPPLHPLSPTAALLSLPPSPSTPHATLTPTHARLHGHSSTSSVSSTSAAPSATSLTVTAAGATGASIGLGTAASPGDSAAARTSSWSSWDTHTQNTHTHSPLLRARTLTPHTSAASGTSADSMANAVSVGRTAAEDTKTTGSRVTDAAGGAGMASVARVWGEGGIVDGDCAIGRLAEESVAENMPPTQYSSGMGYDARYREAWHAGQGDGISRGNKGSSPGTALRRAIAAWTEASEEEAGEDKRETGGAVGAVGEHGPTSHTLPASWGSLRQSLESRQQATHAHANRLVDGRQSATLHHARDTVNSIHLHDDNLYIHDDNVDNITTAYSPHARRTWTNMHNTHVCGCSECLDPSGAGVCTKDSNHVARTGYTGVEHDGVGAEDDSGHDHATTSALAQAEKEETEAALVAQREANMQEAARQRRHRAAQRSLGRLQRALVVGAAQTERRLWRMTVFGTLIILVALAFLAAAILVTRAAVTRAETDLDYIFHSSLLETFLIDALEHNRLAQYLFRNPGASAVAQLFARTETMADASFETVQAVTVARVTASLQAFSSLLRHLDLMPVDHGPLHRLRTESVLPVIEMFVHSKTYMRSHASLLVGFSQFTAFLFNNLYKKYRTDAEDNSTYYATANGLVTFREAAQEHTNLITAQAAAHHASFLHTLVVLLATATISLLLLAVVLIGPIAYRVEATKASILAICAAVPIATRRAQRAKVLQLHALFDSGVEAQRSLDAGLYVNTNANDMANIDADAADSGGHGGVGVGVNAVVYDEPYYSLLPLTHEDKADTADGNAAAHTGTNVGLGAADLHASTSTGMSVGVNAGTNLGARVLSGEEGREAVLSGVAASVSDSYTDVLRRYQHTRMQTAYTRVNNAHAHTRSYVPGSETTGYNTRADVRVGAAHSAPALSDVTDNQNIRDEDAGAVGAVGNMIEAAYGSTSGGGGSGAESTGACVGLDVIAGTGAAVGALSDGHRLNSLLAPPSGLIHKRTSSQHSLAAPLRIRPNEQSGSAALRWATMQHLRRYLWVVLFASLALGLLFTFAQQHTRLAEESQRRLVLAATRAPALQTSYVMVIQHLFFDYHATVATNPNDASVMGGPYGEYGARMLAAARNARHQVIYGDGVSMDMDTRMSTELQALGDTSACTSTREQLQQRLGSLLTLPEHVTRLCASANGGVLAQGLEMALDGVEADLEELLLPSHELFLLPLVAAVPLPPGVTPAMLMAQLARMRRIDSFLNEHVFYWLLVAATHLRDAVTHVYEDLWKHASTLAWVFALLLLATHYRTYQGVRQLAQQSREVAAALLLVPTDVLMEVAAAREYVDTCLRDDDN